MRRCHDDLNGQRRALTEHEARAVVDDDAVHRAAIRADERRRCVRRAVRAADRRAVDHPRVAQVRAARGHGERRRLALEHSGRCRLLRDDGRAQQDEARVVAIRSAERIRHGDLVAADLRVAHVREAQHGGRRARNRDAVERPLIGDRAASRRADGEDSRAARGDDQGRGLRGDSRFRGNVHERDVERHVVAHDRARGVADDDGVGARVGHSHGVERAARRSSRPRCSRRRDATGR